VLIGLNGDFDGVVAGLELLTISGFEVAGADVIGLAATMGFVAVPCDLEGATPKAGFTKGLNEALFVLSVLALVNASNEALPSLLAAASF
jgi:hypothetical protein